MGRQLRRVPLDFNHPVDQVWPGFLNPHYMATKCPDCDGGYSPQYKRLHDQWYGNAPFRPEDRGSQPFTIDTPEVRAFAERNVSCTPSFYGSGEAAIRREAKRLCDLFNGQWAHHLNADDVQVLIDNGRLRDLTGWDEPLRKPTPDEVNRWSINSFGHDSSNAWYVIKAECIRRGWPYTCFTCEGHGDIWPSTEAKELYDQWTETEPPTGEGYQMWETVSEGSPISPVFDSPIKLAQWLELHPRGVDKGTTADQWLTFINGTGWAPSLVGTSSGQLLTGVQAESIK